MEDTAILSKTMFPSPTGLICCDVDGVLVTGNTHNILMNAIEADATLKNNHEAQWKFLSTHPDVKLVGDAETWKSTILKSLESGVPFSFVSYSAFGGYIIPCILQDWVGLDPETIKKIPIVSYLPPKTEQWLGKNRHIDKAQSETNTGDIPSERIVLIEDSPFHIAQAKCRGHKTIDVTQDKKYLETLNILIDTELCQPVQKQEKRNASYLDSSSDDEPLEILVTSPSAQESLAVRQSHNGTPYSSPRTLRDSPIGNSGKKSPSLRKSPLSGTNSPLHCSHEYNANELVEERKSPGVN